MSNPSDKLPIEEELSYFFKSLDEESETLQRIDSLNEEFISFKSDFEAEQQDLQNELETERSKIRNLLQWLTPSYIVSLFRLILTLFGLGIAAYVNLQYRLDKIYDYYIAKTS